MSSSQATQPDKAPTALPPKTARGDGHDPRGRFTPGNRCGRGNPAAQQTAALRQALRAAISPEDITEIAEVLREMALDGNLAAIRLLLSYVVGRPGAGDQDETEPDPPTPATPVMPEELAPAVVTASEGNSDRPAPAVSPGEHPPRVPSANPPPEAPATEAPPPSATVANGPQTPRPPLPTAANGPATRPPPSPAADNGQRPPQWAIRRWPR